jgi:hypothetical protein
MYVTTYVNGSGSTFKYSTNGINWTQGSFSTSNIRYVTFVNGKFLASQIYGDNSGIFYYSTSTDGVNWTSVTQIYVVGTSSNIIYFVKDKFFQTPALNNKLGISTDGITDWEFIDTPVVFNNIICVNNKFYGFSEDNFMSYSSDGYDWSKPVKNLYLASSNKIYDGNKIVSVGCNLSTNFNNMFCTLFKDKKEFDIGMFIPENNYYVFSDLVIEMTD